MDIRDGDWLLINHDPAMGRTVWMKEEWDGGKVVTTFRTDYQVDKLLSENSVARAATHGRKFGEWARIASVPANMVHEGYLADALGSQDQKCISRWLNDSDNRAFRTKEGRV